MKKITAWVLSLCILLGLTACGEQTEEPAAASDTSQSGVSQLAEEESQSSAAAEENTQTAQETGQEHILIAYFSWADNTILEDEESAVQSALSHYEAKLIDSRSHMGLLSYLFASGIQLQVYIL